MFTIENKQLRVQVTGKGAELTSLYHKEHQLEYLWQANPQVWGKHSPVLFPIVGELKEQTYFYKGKKYQLPRHGFAREKNFTLTEQSSEALTFSLSESKETLQVFPFPFLFSLRYLLSDDSLSVTYQVENTGQDSLYFSLGAHPAFNVPLVPGTAYSDYELVFSQTETAGRWPITKEGLIKEQPQPLLNNTNTLPLTKELFQQDALVLKHLQSGSVRLQSGKTPRGLQFQFTSFPYLGLWAKPGADFLCIEPWCGIADSVHSDQQLEHKEGIILLDAGQTFSRKWSVRMF